MKTLALALVCTLALGLALSDARGEWQVWTVTQTVRVLRDAPAGAGTAVRLAAARNEWRGFQILMRSEEPVKGIRVEATNLAGPAGAFLREADTRLYREHQMELTAGSYRNDSFKPGWYPDGLIPFRHPLSGIPLEGGRLAATPFDLPAGETHGFWIDIYVPPDARPGEYRGTYRVIAAMAKDVNLPVTVTVWDFALPATPTLRTEFGSPAARLRGYYRQRAKEGKESEPTEWAAVETQCAQMLADHRLNAVPPAGSIAVKAEADGSFRIPAEQVRAFREFVDRYHVNAFQVPNPMHVVKDPDAERPKLHAWLKAWDAAAAELNRPGLLFYTYLLDEPNDEKAYGVVRRWGKAIREAKSVVKVLVVEQPWPQEEKWGDLYGAVDIWCPLFSLFTPESARARQALGEEIWTYTALCQEKPTPWWEIDFPLLNYRVPAWIAWRYRETGLLYWGGLSYWNQVEDPWTDPKTYGEWKKPKGPGWNGEGVLVYPGRAAGYDGIAPSLRLKALRDSIEDYEYMAILDRAGLAKEAEKIVIPLATSWFQWEKDPAAYEKARARLAALIVAKKAAK
jgi:hypothetical protein